VTGHEWGLGEERGWQEDFVLRHWWFMLRGFHGLQGRATANAAAHYQECLLFGEMLGQSCSWHQV
jgi:hypothetical protein